MATVVPAVVIIGVFAVVFVVVCYFCKCKNKDHHPSPAAGLYISNSCVRVHYLKVILYIYIIYLIMIILFYSFQACNVICSIYISIY